MEEGTLLWTIWAFVVVVSATEVIVEPYAPSVLTACLENLQVVFRPSDSCLSPRSLQLNYVVLRNTTLLFFYHL